MSKIKLVILSQTIQIRVKHVYNSYTKLKFTLEKPFGLHVDIYKYVYNVFILQSELNHIFIVKYSSLKKYRNVYDLNLLRQCGIFYFSSC